MAGWVAEEQGRTRWGGKELEVLQVISGGREEGAGSSGVATGELLRQLLCCGVARRRTTADENTEL